MIAFDSNVLIYFLQDSPEYGNKAEVIFRNINLNGGVCSAIAITETMFGTIDSLDKITPLSSPMIKISPLTANIAASAGRLKISHKLSNADAIHVATAIEAGAEVFITNDKFILKKKIPGIKIRGL